MAKKLSSSGTLEHLIYSPKGGIEGVLVRTGKGEVQWVLDKDDAGTAAQLATVGFGAPLEARVEPMPASDKGPAAHPVYRLLKLGSAESKEKHRDANAVFHGTVVRFNYARHGEANGVVLDNGDFIHTRPSGMQALALRIGSKVEAVGEARRLQHGTGLVVEATKVNGVNVGKHKPAKKAAKKVIKKVARKVAKKSIAPAKPTSIPAAAGKAKKTAARSTPKVRKPLR